LSGQELESLELVGNFPLLQELVRDFQLPQKIGLLLEGHFDLGLHLELSPIFESRIL